MALQDNAQVYPFQNRPKPHQNSCMVDISSQNVSRTPSILPPNSQDFIPAACKYGWINGPPRTAMKLIGDGGPYHPALSGYGAPPCPSAPYGYQWPPSPPQMNVFLENLPASVAQLQLYHLLPPPLTVFGLVRRGTGVFHPRIFTNNATPKVKRGTKNRKQEAKFNPHDNTNSSQGDGLSKGRQEERLRHRHRPLASGMALPKDWTY